MKVQDGIVWRGIIIGDPTLVELKPSERVISATIHLYFYLKKTLIALVCVI